MKPLSHAFEIAYDPSFEVLDQSEVFLDTVEGTPRFSEMILPNLRGRLTADQMHELKQMAELFGRVEQWVTQAATSGTYQVGSVEYKVAWQRLLERAGVFSILASDKIASVSLLLCRDDDHDLLEQPDPRNAPLTAFMSALRHIANDDAGHLDLRKIQLVKMTRRPLLASMFWPPFSPTDSSVVRTIQLQMTCAFFRLNGEIR